ncbi:hypothetical protein D869_gp137 [Caulobacter phage CcrRogue]|uniref:Uncharacterized protein n=1 Tax=Caulobacter phage CcrRogue TaxID=2927986 RepID=K4K3F9_9CAUD|nr:hypothetical protein D869_gp137 [Caulobacter phage CcrRogue]AFU86777.1 hypothetical protein CcrRogue_gp295 [Caulobacter phage CcrRogue]
MIVFLLCAIPYVLVGGCIYAALIDRYVTRETTGSSDDEVGARLIYAIFWMIAIPLHLLAILFDILRHRAFRQRHKLRTGHDIGPWTYTGWL